VFAVATILFALLAAVGARRAAAGRRPG